MKIISNSQDGELLYATILIPKEGGWERVGGVNAGDLGPNPVTIDVKPGTYYVSFHVTNVTGPHKWPAGFLVAQTGGVSDYATVTLREDDAIVLS